MNNKIRAIIIDDEFQNQVLLRDLVVSNSKDIEIVGVFDNIKDGSLFINQSHVDLVFLDIEMPEQIGLDLFSLCASNDFITVIVSAYDQYAIPAIKEGVFDYLLKPIELAELRKTLLKATDEIRKEIGAPEHLKLLINSNIELIDLEEIIALEAAGSYTRFIFRNRPSVLQSHHLAYFENSLTEPRFIRVHRSLIICSSCIKSIDKSQKTLLLKNNMEVKYSSRRWKNIKKYV